MTTIRALRISAGLSQKEFAEALGLSQVSVWQWEHGESLPTADKLPAIAKVLGCTINELFNDDGKEA
jgi:transcriptional regulator with XRE-family HTH domain